MDILLKKSSDKKSSALFIPFVICAVLFIGGCIFGSASMRALDGDDYLFELLFNFKNLTDADSVQISFLDILLHYSKYSAAAFLLGFSCFGIVTIPALSAYRGFSLAFSVSAFIRSMGSEGVLFALILFGIELLALLPSHFIISVNSFMTSRRLTALAFKRSFSEKIYGIQFFKTALISFALQFIAAMLMYFILPYLIRMTIL